MFKDSDHFLLKKPNFVDRVEQYYKLYDVLWFIHQNDYVLQDIKDENIMDDEDGNLYLIDFGMGCK